MPGRRAVSSYCLALQVLDCIAIGGCVFQQNMSASLKSGRGIVRTRVEVERGLPVTHAAVQSVA